MGMMKNYKDKAKGKLKQVQGDINQKRGGTAGIRGGLQKIEGKFQEKVADAKINAENDQDVVDEK